MPSASWLNGWLTGDVVTVGEFRKGVGNVYSSTLGGTAASLDITTLPTYGAALLIVCGLLSDQAGVQNVNIALNNDTVGANYTRNVPSATTTFANGSGNDRLCGLQAQGTSNVAMGVGWLLLPNYLSASVKKGWYVGSVSRDSATTSLPTWGGGHWIAAGATAAVTRVTLSPVAGNFNTNSRIDMYVLGS